MSFAIEQVLQAFGVDVGDPERRAEKAARLAEQGFAPSELEIAFRHLESTSEPGKGPRLIAFMAMNPDRLRATIVDAQAFQAARSEREHGPEVNGAGRLCGAAAEPIETWDHDRMCRAAWCRVHGDHRSPAEVARELRVSEITLGVMLDRGRVLSQSPLVDQKAKVPTPDAVEKAERAGQDRTQEFRRRMDGDRRAARAKATGIERLWDPKRMREAEARILAGVRKDGVVDLAEVLRDPMLRGALATLEADGQITRDGAPDARQRQPYLVAKNEQERAHFRRLIGTQTQRRREEARG